MVSRFIKGYKKTKWYVIEIECGQQTLKYLHKMLANLCTSVRLLAIPLKWLVSVVYVYGFYSRFEVVEIRQAWSENRIRPWKVKRSWVKKEEQVDCTKKKVYLNEPIAVLEQSSVLTTTTHTYLYFRPWCSALSQYMVQGEEVFWVRWLTCGRFNHYVSLRPEALGSFLIPVFFLVPYLRQLRLALK